MAFKLTSGRHIYRHPFPNDGLTLIFRGFEKREDGTEERDLFDKELSKIRSASGIQKKYGNSAAQQEMAKAADKRFTELLTELFRQVATALLVGWVGVEDDDDNPVPLTEETKAVFLADKETEKYWYGIVQNYIWPRKAQETKENEVTLPEVSDADPQFLTSK